MGQALKEILFLRDMNTWALNEHSKHVADLNQLMPDMEQHTNRLINNAQSTDAEHNGTINNVSSTLNT